MLAINHTGVLGSGFIQFKDAADAKKILDASLRIEQADEGGVKLGGRWLNVTPAMSREEAATKEEERKKATEKTAKDKRNLHLMRLAVVRAGTPAAMNMSELDTAKRLKIEANNKAKIKNLHIFVSPTRLCVHNLPATLSDAELRKLLIASVKDKNAELRECRIMRDLARVVNKNKGEGKSRGFAFVEWTQHEHALACLQSLNNNPKTFTDAKRPIVEFSLENMVALNKKKARMEKGRNMNQRWSGYQAPVSGPRPLSQTKATRLKKAVASEEALKATKTHVQKQGLKPLPSHHGPKIRHRKREGGEAATPAAKVPKVDKAKKPFWRSTRKERRIARKTKAKAE